MSTRENSQLAIRHPRSWKRLLIAQGSLKVILKVALKNVLLYLEILKLYILSIADVLF